MFGTSGIRGTVSEEVTAELALMAGRAVASEGYNRVVVSRDVRESGKMLADALTAGLRECGADALEVGVEATPTTARAVDYIGADAGIVVTASHNPATDNGLKFWNPSGKAFGPEQSDAIERRIRENTFELSAWDDLGTRTTHENVRDHHAAALRQAVDIESPLSVVVDLGNGAGTITAAVLHDLGCDVQTLNGQRDGAFPGRPSEPTRETLKTLEIIVEHTEADLGIAHDGDADRMLAVDETGTFVPKDTLLALFAREEASDGDQVAAPVDTSLAVDDALAAVGASLIRTRVGDVHVAERAAGADVIFGGEPSGAWIWPDETLCPDAPLAACKLVELVADRGPLSKYINMIDTYPIRRTSITVADKVDAMDEIRKNVLERYDDIDTLDGVRIDVGDGWFLLRASGTESRVRITAEARDESRAASLFEEATKIVTAATEVIE